MSVTVPDPTHVIISGPTSRPSASSPPSSASPPARAYKGKGIRYEGEFVRRKAGKAFGSK